MKICRKCGCYFEAVSGKICANCKKRHKKQYHLTYYKNNKDKINAQKKIYREANKEKAAIWNKAYYEANKEKIIIRCEIYSEINKEKISLRHKEYYKLNKDKIKLRIKNYYKNNKKAILAHSKIYSKKNEVQINKTTKAYYQKNKDEIIVKRTAYAKANRSKINSYMKGYLEKRKQKKGFNKIRLNHSISAAIRRSLRGQKNGKHWETLVEFTAQQLKKHLEKRFKEGMTWENYGTWHIDHKIPISVFNFTKPEHRDFKKCWALSNLQPMWAHDNISKGNKLTKHFQPSLLL